MHHPAYSLVWQDALYRFQHLRESTTQHQAVEYAVARAGEFLGIMTCPGDLTTRQFVGQCFQWLAERSGMTAGAGR